MRRLAVRASAFLTGLFLLAAAPSASAAPPAFRFERPVTPGAPGANRLTIDEPLLSALEPGSAARAFSDLRLFRPSGEEVPYLLVDPVPPPPESVAGRVLPIPSTKTASGFEVDLGRSVPIDRLDVRGLPPPFLKRLRLEGSGDRSRWTLLVGEGTLFDLPDEGLSRTYLDVPRQELRYLRLTWDDAKSGRVPLPVRVEARVASSAAGAPRPLRLSVPFEKRGSEPGRSRYRVRLPASRLPLAAIEVVPAPGNVLRDAVVTEARLEGSRLVPVSLGRATLRRAVRGDVSAHELSVALQPPEEAELELAIDDGPNPPLELAEVVAVTRPLPWIYFEAPAASGGGAEALVARFGAAGVAVPRYDLEAARAPLLASLRGARAPVLAEARWGERRGLAASAVAETLPPEEGVAVGAPIDVSEFRVVRDVAPGRAGLAALRVDVELLSASETFADVRLVSSDGKQVPYLVEALAEPLLVSLAPLGAVDAAKDPTRPPPAPRVPGRRVYRLARAARELPAGRFTATTPSRVFSRRVALLLVAPREGPEALRRGRDGVESLAETTWSHADPDRAAPPLSLELPRLPAGELFLAVDDGDNAPLPVESPTVALPTYRLRFLRRPADAAGLRLVYGRPGLAPPRYDLALLAPRLLGAPVTEVSAAPESAMGKRDVGSRRERLAFWGILVAAVLALLALVARLVRTGDAAGGGP